MAGRLEAPSSSDRRTGRARFPVADVLTAFEEITPAWVSADSMSGRARRSDTGRRGGLRPSRPHLPEAIPTAKPGRSLASGRSSREYDPAVGFVELARISARESRADYTPRSPQPSTWIQGFRFGGRTPQCIAGRPRNRLLTRELQVDGRSEVVFRDSSRALRFRGQPAMPSGSRGGLRDFRRHISPAARRRVRASRATDSEGPTAPQYVVGVHRRG